MEQEAKRSVKDRVIEEFRAFWLLAFYLWLFFASFTFYRRMVLAEHGYSSLHYGIAAIEALVVAKVVLIGKLFGVSRKFEDRALIIPTIYKTILFAIFVFIFTLVEWLIDGWIHRQGLLGGLHKFRDLGGYEIAARMVILVVAFVPIFAFGELCRVIGAEKLSAMFFSKGEPHVKVARPAV